MIWMRKTNRRSVVDRKKPKQEQREMNWLLLFMSVVIAAAFVWVVYEVFHLALTPAGE